MNGELQKTRKDDDGDITHLCNEGKLWSPRKSADAIKDIESEDYAYYVLHKSKRVYIHVVNGENGKYLRTNPDETEADNLDELPDC